MTRQVSNSKRAHGGLTVASSQTSSQMFHKFCKIKDSAGKSSPWVGNNGAKDFIGSVSSASNSSASSLEKLVVAACMTDVAKAEHEENL
ncbi:hypothetical protein NL676_029591 [Syzygium grande]|nr:hypothetical protein NL676_029591 [Syzygium grande]